MSKGFNFASLVHEAVATDRLKNMIRYRRRALEKLHTRGAQSVTERILGFVQGEVVVASLLRASNLRTQRAYGRAR